MVVKLVEYAIKSLFIGLLLKAGLVILNAVIPLYQYANNVFIDKSRKWYLDPTHVDVIPIIFFVLAAVLLIAAIVINKRKDNKTK